LVPGTCGGTGLAQDAVRAYPTENLDRQITQQGSDPGRVTAGIQHDQDLRVTGLPLASGDESLEDLADLCGAHGGDISAGRQSDRVGQRSPRGASGLKAPPRSSKASRGPSDAGPYPAHRYDKTNAVVRCGLWPQPRRHVHRQHQPPVSRPGQRQTGQRSAQPLHLDPTAVDRALQGTVAAPILRRQRRPHQ